MYEELTAAIRDKTAILFVGAGVSATLGVPTWRGLIDHMAADLGYDPALFASPSGNFMTLAEYHNIERGGVGALRSWMDTNWVATDQELQSSKIHNLIVRLGLPLIYTTNYDRFLERALRLAGKDVAKIVNVRDLRAARDGQVHVVKFHGDFDSDESIVLTEGDYFRRLAFDSPLDIKLRSDVLGRSILFVGYSLSDINIRLLLFKLTQTWDSSGQRSHRPQSYVFSPRPDPIQEAVLGKWGVQLISEDTDDPDLALTTFLSRLADNAMT